MRQSLSVATITRETMNCFAGLDVSLEETCVCIVDHDGRIVRDRP